MDEQVLRQQQRYDQGWRGAIEQGRAHRGNLLTNLEFLDRTALLKPTDKMLEIGCGAGGIVAELTRRGHDIVGTDLSHEIIAYGLQLHGNIRLEVQAAEELSYADGTFDAKVRRKVTFVDPAACTGCSDCERVCTVAIADRFNENLAASRASSTCASSTSSTRRRCRRRPTAWSSRPCGVTTSCARA
jgi:SAM-dependent methyltransferase